jgi:CobQ-like glutamine amidotransferase family enzyme
MALRAKPAALTGTYLHGSGLELNPPVTDFVTSSLSSKYEATQNLSLR